VTELNANYLLERAPPALGRREDDVAAAVRSGDVQWAVIEAKAEEVET
jgi:hypothetical protein